jgi:hypothetical protein
VVEYVEDVAPEILVYVVPSLEDCHWYVIPVRFVKELWFCKDNVYETPEQTRLEVELVAPGAGVTEQAGIATTVNV